MDTNVKNKKPYTKKPTSKGGNKAQHKPVQPVAPQYVRGFEYKMAPGMYAQLVQEYKKHPVGSLQDYLCNYVNEQFGLLGTCLQVLAG